MVVLCCNMCSMFNSFFSLSPYLTENTLCCICPMLNCFFGFSAYLTQNLETSRLWRGHIYWSNSFENIKTMRVFGCCDNLHCLQNFSNSWRLALAAIFRKTRMVIILDQSFFEDKWEYAEEYLRRSLQRSTNKTIQCSLRVPIGLDCERICSR
jgi:hypothetical protein